MNLKREILHSETRNNTEQPFPAEAEGLTRSYGDVTAIRGIDLTVEREEIFGLIGPDGSGKTTLLRILATLLIPDSGRASVEGMDTLRDMRKIRKIIGYMPGSFSLYRDLTVRENLNFFAAVFNTTVEENYELIRPIYSHIERFSGRKAGNLSGGMKQKLALSCALIHRPRLLLLDEPNTGVDAVSRSQLWDMLFELREEGMTIAVSTPYMEEARMCDRVALMQDGRILKVDSPASIVKEFPHDLYRVRSSRMRNLTEDLEEYGSAVSAHRFGDSVHFSMEAGESAGDELRGYLESKGHSGIEMERIEPSIEDSFIELMTGRPGPDE